jgi:hypothetical protein
MKKEFNDLDWHDAELQSIYIDRSIPGESDQVVLNIRWPNAIKSEVIFNDCYAFKALMNFGIVVAEETIRDADFIEHSEELNEIRRTWEKVDVDLSGLRQYQIETNSTNSMLKIFARSMNIKDSKD